jgi:GT2 family glycosyltransferase
MTGTINHSPTCGVVVIGRNEGERLVRCLDSIAPSGLPIVYVDSGSTDGSQKTARDRAVSVIDLDTRIPFTAARARNAGFRALLGAHPSVQFVQFVDGDCEMIPGWIERGIEAISREDKLAVVCGRLRERYPDASVYNRLCDIEWDGPVGLIDACGGIAMMRVGAFDAAGGFNPKLIAGEEPELCLRLRREGWKIERIVSDMTLHDAAMTRFSQWWKRAMRAGHAQAEGAAMHGSSIERYCVRSVQRSWFYGAIVPLIVLGALIPTHGWSLLLLAIYPLLAMRIAMRSKERGLSLAHRLLYAAACVIGKFPEMIGQLGFLRSRISGRQSVLIEYKHPRTV